MQGGAAGRQREEAVEAAGAGGLGARLAAAAALGHFLFHVVVTHAVKRHGAVRGFVRRRLQGAAGGV